MVLPLTTPTNMVYYLWLYVSISMNIWHNVIILGRSHLFSGNILLILRSRGWRVYTYALLVHNSHRTDPPELSGFPHFGQDSCPEPLSPFPPWLRPPPPQESRELMRRRERLVIIGGVRRRVTGGHPWSYPTGKALRAEETNQYSLNTFCTSFTVSVACILPLLAPSTPCLSVLHNKTPPGFATIISFVSRGNYDNVPLIKIGT